MLRRSALRVQALTAEKRELQRHIAAVLHGQAPQPLQQHPAYDIAQRASSTGAITESSSGSLDWATAWLRVTPQRLFSFAERAWRDASPRS